MEAILSEPAPSERISVRNLSVDYHGIVALHDVSLQVQASSLCGLVGMNGAGKSTLFKALMGFVHPSKAASPSMAGRCGRRAAARPSPTCPRWRAWIGTSR